MLPDNLILNEVAYTLPGNLFSSISDHLPVFTTFKFNNSDPVIDDDLRNEVGNIDLSNTESAINSIGFDLLTPNKENAIKSSLYFHGLEEQREKKFKGKLKAGKEDEKVQEIQLKRKSLENELTATIHKNLATNVVETILYHAEEGTSINDLFFNTNDMPTMPDKIKDTYNGLVEIVQDYIPSTFWIDFENMSADEASGYLSIGRSQGYEKKAGKGWEKYKKKFHELLSTHWSTTELELNNKTETIRRHFQRLKSFNANKNIISKALSDKIKEMPDDDDLNSKNCISVISSMLCIISDQLAGKRYKFLNSSGLLLTTLKSALQDEDGHKYVESIVQVILKNEYVIPSLKDGVVTSEFSKFTSLVTLRKQQKQHSLARFFNLINYYTAFVNIVQHLSELAETKKSGLKNITKKVILQILENCHIEIPDNQNSKNLNAVKELKNRITIMPQAHRERNIMGYEETVIPEILKKLNIDRLNVLLGTYKNEDIISKLERAHTLPFPACFAWDEDKIISFISEATNEPLQRQKNKVELLADVKVLRSEMLYFNKDLFIELTKKGKDHKEIEEIFNNQILKYAETEKDPNQFLYSSFNLVRKFYLRLFSETAFLPDFINEELDVISEWRLKKEEDNYKRALATSLQALIKKDGLSTKSDVTNHLKPFFKESVLSAIKCYHHLFPDQSEYSIFKRILVCQVEESLRMTILEVATEGLFQEIFREESVLKDPMCKDFYNGKKVVKSRPTVKVVDVAPTDDSSYNCDIENFY